MPISPHVSFTFTPASATHFSLAPIPKHQGLMAHAQIAENCRYFAATLQPAEELLYRLAMQNMLPLLITSYTHFAQRAASFHTNCVLAGALKNRTSCAQCISHVFSYMSGGHISTK